MKDKKKAESQDRDPNRVLSLNIGSRREEMRKINRENLGILKKIQECKPFMNMRKVESESKKRKILLN